MNILILAAGRVHFDSNDNNYPLCLTELDGTPLIERLISSCKVIDNAKFIIALRESDICCYHLDNIIHLLAPNAKIIRITADTCGAACTALLAAGTINNDEELLILNGNELLNENFSKILKDFRLRNLVAGTVVFSSIHPRYSYVRLNTENLVIEAAEKNPISRHATAGFYWFLQGKDFVRAAQNMMRKDASVNGLFYICPSLNELVLEQARIGIYPIHAHQYHPLKTERHLTTRYEVSYETEKSL